MNHLSGGGVIKPNVSLIKEGNSVNYISQGVNVKAESTVSNSSPIVYTINGKQYISKVSEKNDRGQYKHELSVHIPNDKFVLESIKQENEPSCAAIVFATYLNDVDNPKPIQSKELTDYLNGHPDIDIKNITSEQKLNIIKNTSVEIVQISSTTYWYGFGSGNLTDESTSSDPIECKIPFTINDINQINSILLVGSLASID